VRTYHSRTSKVKLTNDDVAEIRDMYNNKKFSPDDLVQKFNVTKSYLLDIISNKQRVDTNYKRTRFSNIPEILSDKDVTDIRELYNDENTSFSELARQFYITRDYVVAVIDNKAHYDSQYVRTRFEVELTDDDAAEIRNLYDNKNIEISELEDIYNITTKFVRDILSNKIFYDENYIKNENVIYKLSDKDVAEIRNLYNSSEVSYSELAVKFGITSGYVKEIVSNTKRIDKNYTRTRYSRMSKKNEVEVGELTAEDATEIRKLYNADKINLSEIANIYNVDTSYIRDIVGNEALYDENYTRRRFPAKLTKKDVEDRGYKISIQY
jgi:DNA-binding MarR family transcriptional regulator